MAITQVNPIELSTMSTPDLATTLSESWDQVKSQIDDVDTRQTFESMIGVVVSRLMGNYETAWSDNSTTVSTTGKGTSVGPK